MSSVLCFTLRFLDPVPQFHGRGDDGDAEWPPSPLRFFQSLVSAAAQRWRDGQFRDYAQPALQWLERLQPSLVTPEVEAQSFGYRMYVPNNSGDLMTAAWARGDTDTSMAKFRVEKDVRPLKLQGEAIRFLFPLPDGACPHFDVLQGAARSITHLGWGIDMVAGNAELLTDEQAAVLQGDVWRASHDQFGTALRISTAGTLKALLEKHQKFLGRLSNGDFEPVPPLREFAVRNYRRSTDIEPRPHCVFTILNPDASGNRAFSTARRTRDVAAWIRHAVAEVCNDWPDLGSFVHGHGADNGPNNRENSSDRFQYLPLPTINSHLKRVESIRRVMVVAPAGREDRIDFIRRRLLGHELRWDNNVVGILNLQPGKDWVRDQYTGTSTTWSSVTPVILDGFNDKNSAKTEKLIHKALANAGISHEVEFEWQPFGFRSGVEPVREFKRPEKLNGTMVHVRLRFKQKMRGPFAIGAGRYRGFGLMAIDK